MGINLDNAIEAHANWRTKLRTAATRQEKMDADSAARDDCCELGKWLHGPGQSKFGSRPTFVSLISLHRVFHQEAGKVARLINQGDFERAVQQIGSGTSFSSASSKVGAAVVALKADLKKESAAPARKTPAKAAVKALPSSVEGDWETF